jgi:hypothetical protein
MCLRVSFKKKNSFPSLKSLKKGAGSGSVSQKLQKTHTDLQREHPRLQNKKFSVLFLYLPGSRYRGSLAVSVYLR